MSSRRRLRSPGFDRLHIPIIRRPTFTVSGAALQNDLLAHVTAAPSLAVFRQRLKTFCFLAHRPTLTLSLNPKTICTRFYKSRNARIASAVLATAIPSVRLSVCLSVTRRYCVKTTARSTVQFALSDSKMCLVL